MKPPRFAESQWTVSFTTTSTHGPSCSLDQDWLAWWPGLPGMESSSPLFPLPPFLGKEEKEGWKWEASLSDLPLPGRCGSRWNILLQQTRFGPSICAAMHQALLIVPSGLGVSIGESTIENPNLKEKLPRLKSDEVLTFWEERGFFPAREMISVS